MDVRKPSMMILLVAFFRETDLRQQVSGTSFSAFFEGLILAGCLNYAIDDPVSVIISSVVYFCIRKFAACV